MNQKGFINIVIIILVVAIAGTVGYFALVKKQTLPIETNQPQQTNTPVTSQTPTTKNNPTATQQATSINNKLVVCDSEKEKEISRLRQEGGVVKDIDSRSPIIVGFYTTRENPHLKETYRDLEQATKYGWGEFYDFIEGYAPPTPLSGLGQHFNDGDLIKIEPDWTKDGLALQVKRAEKFSLPTRQDFLGQAEKTFNTNLEGIFQCANSRSSDFPSFMSAIEPTVVWNRLTNQALVTYQGTQEYKGSVKVVNVSIMLDQSGTPLSIFVGSKVVPLTL